MPETRRPTYIGLMHPRCFSVGPNFEMRSYVFPSESLRALVLKRMRARRPWLTYVNTWCDVHGFGLTLATIPDGYKFPG